MKCSVLSVLLPLTLAILPALSYADEVDKITEYDSLCVDEHLIAQRRIAALDKKVKRYSKARTDKIDARAVVIDVSEQAEPIPGIYSLQISLDQLQTKRYLRNEKLVLVGGGFDDEALLNRADDLEFNGFRNVEVLANGRRSALINESDYADKRPKSTLFYVGAVTALSTATTSYIPNEYLFVTWGGSLPSLNEYGINSTELEHESMNELLSNLDSLIDDTLANNRYTKIVLVISGDDDKRAILGNSKLAGNPNLWLIKGGRNALSHAVANTKIPPKRMRDHKFSCTLR